MKRLNLRFLFPIFTFAMILLLATTAQASPATQAEPTPTPLPPGVSIPGQGIGGNGVADASGLPDCRECHWDIFLVWEESSHGKGLSCSQCHLAVSEDNNHARSGHGAQEGGSQECMACHTTGYDSKTDTWNEGNIHCTACHTPVPSTHPEEPAPTNRSSDMCGQCHIQANFEWQLSTHGLANISCVDCHNQHRASLKTASEEIHDQCAACHRSVEAGFTQSLHADQGLSCGDCHLAPLGNISLAGGNARLNHTFEVDISACLQCHAEMLHAPKEQELDEDEAFAEEGEVDAMASAANFEIQSEAPAVSPTGFLAFAAVFGVGAGMGALTWFADIFRKARKRKSNEQED